MNRFFIRDCNDAIVGNPAGYRTMRGAAAQENKPGSPAWIAIWAAYDARVVSYDHIGMPLDQRRRNICSIRLNEEI